MKTGDDYYTGVRACTRIATVESIPLYANNTAPGRLIGRVLRGPNSKNNTPLEIIRENGRGDIVILGLGGGTRERRAVAGLVDRAPGYIVRARDRRPRGCLIAVRQPDDE